MTRKKRRKVPSHALQDSELRLALVDALRTETMKANVESKYLDSILGELISIRALLEREATNLDLPAVKKKPRRRRASK